MKTKFKTLTVEPEYNILKNKNFRNNQNYITSKKKFLGISENINAIEKQIETFISVGGMLLLFYLAGLISVYNNGEYSILIIILCYFLLFPLFLFIINFKQYLLQRSRKNKYVIIKMIINKNYYMILDRIGGNIVKKSYD